jgi:hypothetical protein
VDCGCEVDWTPRFGKRRKMLMTACGVEGWSSNKLNIHCCGRDTRCGGSSWSPRKNWAINECISNRQTGRRRGGFSGPSTDNELRTLDRLRSSSGQRVLPNTKLVTGIESKVDRIDAFWPGKFCSQCQPSAEICGFKSYDSRDNNTIAPPISVTA